jgi:hypothetical protein
MERKVGICVGGPFDGRQVETKGEPFFKALSMPRVPLMAFPVDGFELAKSTETPYTFYVWETLRCPPTKDDPRCRGFGIWRPEQQSLADTMAMLITGYHPAVVIDY